MLIYDLSTLEMVGKGYNHEKHAKGERKDRPTWRNWEDIRKQRGKKWENVGDNGQSIWKTHWKTKGEPSTTLW